LKVNCVVGLVTVAVVGETSFLLVCWTVGFGRFVCGTNTGVLECSYGEIQQDGTVPDGGVLSASVSSLPGVPACLSTIRLYVRTFVYKNEESILASTGVLLSTAVES
jgi:hypothetical protein